MLNGGSKRTYIAAVWDIDTYNAGVANGFQVGSTDHILILEDDTALTALDSDWLDATGAELTTVTLPIGRYEMNAKSFAASAPVMLITV